MAGILDNKERIIDFIVTEEGKRQATAGQMKIEFASFTDYHTFYAASGSSGGGDPIGAPGIAADASKRIFFEATNRFQDVIVPELEAGTALRGFRTADFDFGGKVIASGSTKVGFAQRANVLTGSQIVATAQRAMDGIANNFSDLRILGTVDEFADSTDFSLSRATGSFHLTSRTEYGRALRTGAAAGTAALEAVPSLFADRRFSHFPNFKYLPPRNEPVPGAVKGATLGSYPKLNEPEIVSLQDLEAQLADKQYIDINFSETSRDNNLICQLFEFSAAKVEKLSIVDFGEFGDEDPFSPGKRVFFVGKILKDAAGAETFLNVFTMVFD